ncbi:MAG: hypothetical protein JRH20_09340 [Deltaproteobacteria bacterium]|nr:hypothetical protein [Deltaproteobacteria bacterium]
MARRGRLHVNPYTFNGLAGRKEPLVVPQGRPLEVELGCGDGLFIVERAALKSDVFCLGIDIRESFLSPGRARIDELALDNVVLETANLIVDLGDLFRAGRVQRFFINFPDPFFKRRHHHRRWLTEDAVNQLVCALEQDGELIYQSDVWELALEALTLFSMHSALHNTCGYFSFCQGRVAEPRTSHEKVWEKFKRKIWRMSFVRH